METAEKKVKRAVRKREKLKAVREAAASGPATAYLNNVPTSPRKMRLVVDLIRGQRVNKALNILKYEAKHPTIRLEKLLHHDDFHHHVGAPNQQHVPAHEQWC